MFSEANKGKRFNLQRLFLKNKEGDHFRLFPDEEYLSSIQASSTGSMTDLFTTQKMCPLQVKIIFRLTLVF